MTIDPTPSPTPGSAATPRAGWAAVVVAAVVAMAPSAKALHVGNRVQANQNGNVRTAAAGALAGTRTTGDTGTVAAGPVTAALNGGSPLVWWQVDWETGPDGWCFEGGLDQRTLTHGIDISNYQGDVDWARIAGSGERTFAIVKATEGTGFVDAKFARNMSLGRAAGVLMGAYHFARPGAIPTLTADALAEARHFVKTLHPWLDDGGLRPVLDLEDGSALGKAALSSWSRTFLNEVARLTTSRSIVYTSRTYAQNYIDDDLAVHPLWIAVPETTPGANTFALGPWPRWTFQQHSWTGRVPGITGDVDLNVYSGDPSQLQAHVLPALTHTLDDLQATPATAARGATVTLTVRVTSSAARSLLLGATIFPAGTSAGGTSDRTGDRMVSLAAGSGQVVRSFALPADLPAGDYDLVMALYVDLDASGTINAGDLPVGGSRRKASALGVATVPAFATWAAAAGLTGPAAAVTADPDADGWTNLLEYAFGTSPTTPGGPPSLILGAGPEQPAAGPPRLQLRFPRWPDRTDLTYHLQRSADPGAGEWVTLATAARGAAFSGDGIRETGTSPVAVTVDLPSGPEAAAFWRVAVARE